MHGAQPGFDKIAEALERMVATDRQDREQTNVSWMALQLVRMTMASEIGRILESQGSVTEAELRDLLMGQKGLCLVGKMMFNAAGVPLK